MIAKVFPADPDGTKYISFSFELINFATDCRAEIIIFLLSCPNWYVLDGLPHMSNMDIKYSFIVFDNGVVAALSKYILFSKIISPPNLNHNYTIFYIPQQCLLLKISLQE